MVTKIIKLFLFIILVTLCFGCAVQKNASENMTINQTRENRSSGMYPFPKWNDRFGKKVIVSLEPPNLKDQFLQGVLLSKAQIGIEADYVLWTNGHIQPEPGQTIFIHVSSEENAPKVSLKVKEFAWKMSDGSWNAYSFNLHPPGDKE